jgi:hypothetical protein
MKNTSLIQDGPKSQSNTQIQEFNYVLVLGNIYIAYTIHRTYCSTYRKNVQNHCVLKKNQ